MKAKTRSIGNDTSWESPRHIAARPRRVAATSTIVRFARDAQGSYGVRAGDQSRLDGGADL